LVAGIGRRHWSQALVAGNEHTPEPAPLAPLARGRLREKLPESERARAGQFQAHQRFLVAQQLAHVDFLDGLIERVSAEIAERVHPCEDSVTLLDTIPGIGRRTAESIVAEVGVDLQRFPSAAHRAAWAGLAPGNNESAGKRRPAATRKGRPWLRAALVEAAQAAGRTKNTYLGAQYRRLMPRKGKKRAAVAVAHTILVIAYYVLTRHEPYRDLGPNYFDERARQAVEHRLVHRLEALGYTVSLQPPGSAA
jgi:transposase